MSIKSKRVGDLVGILAETRRKCDECLRDRTDPGRALKSVAVLVDEAGGDIHIMRGFAPGLGDVWDTLRSVLSVAIASTDWPRSPGGGGEDEGLHDPARAVADVGGSVPVGYEDEGDLGAVLDPGD